MSEQDARPLLPLTPTERRIAETAYAAHGVWMAVEKVFHLRGVRGPFAGPPPDELCASLLAELRRVPEPDECDVCKLFSDSAGTWRSLVERIVLAVDNRGLDFVDGNGNDLLEALDDARKELGL